MQKRMNKDFSIKRVVVGVFVGALMLVNGFIIYQYNDALKEIRKQGLEIEQIQQALALSAELHALSAEYQDMETMRLDAIQDIVRYHNELLKVKEPEFEVENGKEINL